MASTGKASTTTSPASQDDQIGALSKQFPDVDAGIILDVLAVSNADADVAAANLLNMMRSNGLPCKECIICLDAPRATRFDCGHACCCIDCAGVLLARADPRCPTCREPVTSFISGPDEEGTPIASQVSYRGGPPLTHWRKWMYMRMGRLLPAETWRELNWLGTRALVACPAMGGVLLVWLMFWLLHSPLLHAWLASFAPAYLQLAAPPGPSPPPGTPPLPPAPPFPPALLGPDWLTAYITDGWVSAALMWLLLRLQDAAIAVVGGGFAMWWHRVSPRPQRCAAYTLLLAVFSSAALVVGFLASALLSALLNKEAVAIVAFLLGWLVFLIIVHRAPQTVILEGVRYGRSMF